MNIKDLIKESYSHYQKKHYRKQWIKQTYELMTRGNHLALTGRFPRKVM